MFFYSLALHALVLFTLLRWNTATAPTSSQFQVVELCIPTAALADSGCLRRQARLGVFFYSLALHALVLFTLLRWGHASHGHASVGEAELQLLCQRARVVSPLCLSHAHVVMVVHLTHHASVGEAELQLHCQRARAVSSRCRTCNLGLGCPCSLGCAMVVLVGQAG